MAKPVIVVVMGVSGCGKSTVAQQIAVHLGCLYTDGDDLHPEHNRSKMSSGQPLSDADRIPWLEAVRDHAESEALRHGVCIIACSALKQAYRHILRSTCVDVFFVFLKGSRAVIAARMAQRKNHFMPAGLLDSQIATLESPEHEAGVITVDIDSSPDAVVGAALAALNQLSPFSEHTQDPL